MSDTAISEPAGSASGGVRTLLRLEGLTLFAGMTLLYAVWEGSWLVYAILFLAPDLSFAAYLAGPKPGAIVYNAAHSYMAPVALLTLGFGFASPLTLSIAMIWLALSLASRKSFPCRPTKPDPCGSGMSMLIRAPWMLFMNSFPRNCSGQEAPW